MEESTLIGFRELLVTRLGALLDGTGKRWGSTDAGAGSNDPMDSADMASHHTDQELLHSIRYRNQQLVREILAAIKRIDDGEFGTCRLCSGSIGMKRLHVQPTARLCIRCQGVMETPRRRLPAA